MIDPNLFCVLNLGKLQLFSNFKDVETEVLYLMLRVNLSASCTLQETWLFKFIGTLDINLEFALCIKTVHNTKTVGTFVDQTMRY